MKKLLSAFILLTLVTILVVACGGSSGGGGGATVHMNSTNFTQSSVTITKGSSLTLVDDVAVTHMITNGSWDNGVPKPMPEAGAPTVNATFNGDDSQTIGPFNTAGTFHLYCTIHSGMNLTVIVQ
jgi:plastocyanin